MEMAELLSLKVYPFTLIQCQTELCINGKKMKHTIIILQEFLRIFHKNRYSAMA